MAPISSVATQHLHRRIELAAATGLTSSLKGAIAGAVVAIVVLIAGMIAMVVFYFRSSPRPRTSKYYTQDPLDIAEKVPESNLESEPVSPTYPHRLESSSTIVVPEPSARSYPSSPSTPTKPEKLIIPARGPGSGVSTPDSTNTLVNSRDGSVEELPKAHRKSHVSRSSVGTIENEKLKRMSAVSALSPTAMSPTNGPQVAVY